MHGGGWVGARPSATRMIARDYVLELTAPLPHRHQTSHSYTWRGEGITLVNLVAAI